MVWKKLEDLSRGPRTAWAVIGDFNDIASGKEKTGGGMKEPRSIKKFLEMMSNARLKTLASKGLAYTWTNKREEEVREKLDRVLVNVEWIEAFPNSVVQNLPLLGSDHSPMLLQLEVQERKARKTFKFELNWVEEKGCGEVVEDNWKTDKVGSHGFRLMRKLNACSKGLWEWSRKHFPNNRKRIDEIMVKLKELQARESNNEIRKLIKEYEEELEVVWSREERFWLQRSRIKWLWWGDRNTKFFHQRTLMRRQRNRVTRLKDENGMWLEEEEQIAERIKGYFQELFTSN